MAETIQTAVLPRQGARKQPAFTALAALGVVYGDIGTSTLYGLKQAAEAGGAPTPDTVMGIVSVILWSLILIVALKYAILICALAITERAASLHCWRCSTQGAHRAGAGVPPCSSSV
jgi:K+ transporter